MLSAIPDRELMRRLEELRHNERDTDLDLLHHLNEVERRSLHLRLGYSSLFSYCTGHLGYSESDAGRRVQAARCLNRFPSVATMLKSGEINLMTLGLIANIVTEQTVNQWLEKIRGKSQREVEALVAAVRTPVYLRERARLVNVVVPSRSPLPMDPVEKTPPRESNAGETLFTPPRAQAAEPSAPPIETATKSEAPAMQSRVYIQFLVDHSFMVKYRTAIAVLSNRIPRLTFEAVFTALLEDFIKRHEPSERHQRREQRTMRDYERAGRTPIPVGMRDAVFKRDLGRCTYVGSDGKRCNETIRLHVDHIKPLARGGTNDVSNLRLLCAQHNRLQAEKIFGRQRMNQFRKNP